jgi:hypothetical protein
MVRALLDMAEHIEIASTFQDDPATDPGHLRGVWSNVQRSHLVLDRLSYEAALYASDEAISTSRKIADSVQRIADDTDAFDPQSGGRDDVAPRVERIRGLLPKLYRATEPLGAEARRHLGIR